MTIKTKFNMGDTAWRISESNGKYKAHQCTISAIIPGAIGQMGTNETKYGTGSTAHPESALFKSKKALLASL